MSTETEPVSKPRLLFALSFVVPFSQEATGDGFTRGLNRVGSFLIWQGSALVVAVVTLLVGFSQRFSGSRWLSRTPAIVHALAILLAVGAVLVASNQSSQIQADIPALPVTAPASDLSLTPKPPLNSESPAAVETQPQ